MKWLQGRVDASVDGDVGLGFMVRRKRRGLAEMLWRFGEHQTDVGLEVWSSWYGVTRRCSTECAWSFVVAP